MTPNNLLIRQQLIRGTLLLLALLCLMPAALSGPVRASGPSAAPLTGALVTGGTDKPARPLDTWAALGSGLSLDANGIAVSGSDVYVAGAFSSAGGLPANHVARWDGSTWSALGSGLNSGANAVAVSGTNVYAGGAFTTAGGAPASRIARWDGSAWSALGSGVNSNVYAIAVSGSNVYVGGVFTTAGGVPASRIARWDGSTWSALGSGVNGDVLTIAVSGSSIYVGGFFSTAGGVPARDIARWDGSTWSALGSGADYYVQALALSGSNLYVAGQFTHAGGIAANHIARWDGAAWSTLGSGLDHNVFALAVIGDALYAGGRFSNAGGTPASRVAGWNGTTWFDLAGGVTYPGQTPIVYALAPSGTNLYVGGNFTTAGSIPAANIALYQTTGLPTVTPGPSATPTNTPQPTSTRTPTPSPPPTVTPVPGDNPPIITLPLNEPYRIGVEVGNYLALRVDARDPDTGDIVQLGVSGLPAGASFPLPPAGNPVYSTLTWRPTAPDIGTYYVIVTATDNHGAVASATVRIDVVAGCVPYFSDVLTTQYFYPAVQYLFCHFVVSGYTEADQTFTYRPFNNTTRGQFSKMIALAYFLPAYNPPTPDFSDVPASDPFYPYVEAAFHAGIISGYADGTFHPYTSITRGQLCKLIVGAAGWPIDTSGAPHFADVPPTSPFYAFVETAYNHAVISGYTCGGPGEPCDPQQRPYFRAGNPAIRGQIAKILWQALGSPPLR
ncbi:MAG TPA: S-layer homology domain-containing protein [Chloroflexia bacterium]|nr:S-layer homology domain-containing protein [Chloroflexia bacterium]